MCFYSVLAALEKEFLLLTKALENSLHLLQKESLVVMNICN